MIVLRDNYHIVFCQSFWPLGKHVFTFLSFKVVLFIVIPTAFQKTNNFYLLCSFNHWFSIWISFLDKQKIISVQLQNLASYLYYKMTVEFDCTVITVSSGRLFKSILLKYYSNSNLPTPLAYIYQYFRIIILNRYHIFGDLFCFRKSSEPKYNKLIKEM